MRTIIRAVAVLAAIVLTASARGGELFRPWIDGTDANEPALQVQQLDPDTYVLRQSFHSTPQAPFLYLLFGQDRALLLDTGDGGHVRPTVDALIDKWLAGRHKKSIALVVAHSHSHSDHHAGDAEFAGRPATTVVGLRPADVADFFKITDWPESIVTFDLGGRILDVIPAPGHERAHIVLFDRRTGALLTGDLLLAGHVLIPFDQIETFRRSVDRVADFVAGKKVTYVLGTHIEMSRTSGKDFSFDAKMHPDEHVLELPASAIQELREGLKRLGGALDPQVHDDFIILGVPPEVMAPYEFRG